MGKLQFMHESCLYGAFCALLKVVMIVFGQKNTSLRVHLIWICLLLLCCSGSVYALCIGLSHNHRSCWLATILIETFIVAWHRNANSVRRLSIFAIFCDSTLSHCGAVTLIAGEFGLVVGGMRGSVAPALCYMQMSIINRRGAQGCQRCQTRIHSIGSGTHSMCALEYYMQYYILTILYQSPFEAKLSRVLGCWVCVCVCSRSRRRYDAKRTNCWLVLRIFLQPCKRARAHTMPSLGCLAASRWPSHKQPTHARCAFFTLLVFVVVVVVF